MRRLAVFLLVVIAAVASPVAFGGAGTVTAQPATASATEAPDYEAWVSVAERAEEALESGRASDEAYEALRAELAEWRARFLSAQSINAERIGTVRGQIEALGTPPEEGATEPEEVAARRTELNDLLVALQAPARRADEAFTRAEGLIREIDTVLRGRQAEALLERVRSPLNPAGWPEALHEIRTTALGVGAEVRTNWTNPARRAALRDDLPITLALLFIALVLLVRGRVWMERLTLRVFDRLGSRVAGLALSTGQVIVPIAGFVLLAGSLGSTGLLGLRGRALIEALPVLVLSFFMARWLAGRLFPKKGESLLAGDMPEETRRTLRWHGGAIGLVLGLGGVAALMAEHDGYSEDVLAAVLFPFQVILGLLMFRLGRRLIRHAQAQRAEDAASVFQSSLLLFLARGATLLGVLGPILAAAGYQGASEFTVLPATLTLALAGVVTVLNRLVNDLYALVTGSNEEQTREALLPTLVGFLIVLAAVPFLALIWGARVADLTELWTRFLEGFSIGDTRISPTDFLTFLVIFAIGYGATRLSQNALRTAVLPKTRLDAGGRNAVVAGLGYVGIFLAAIIAITAAGIDLSSLAIVAGALSVGVGFGLQNIVQNFVAGIILLVERPVAEGDWIEVGGHQGIVKSISVRSTRIETWDRNDVIVPNADFVSGAVKNWTRGNSMGRIVIDVGVAYGSDTRKVERILHDIAMEHPLVVLDPEPGIDFVEFGASSLDFRIRAVLSDIAYGLNVRTEIRHQIAERFAEEGIEVPFAQRDIWLRNPEALTGQPARPEPARPPKKADLSEAQLGEAEIPDPGTGTGEDGGGDGR